MTGKSFLLRGALAALLVSAAPLAAAQTDDAAAAGRALIAAVQQHALLMQREAGIAPPSLRVLAAMARVPRHRFLPPALAPYAYLDRPLPVGHGQNIAQPYIIALMTDLAEIGPEDTVFETGTDVGYHAAILSLLARRVYSVEVVEPLAHAAAARLDAQGYANVEVRAADGYFGWVERAPFDVMIIKEAVDHIPEAWQSQLKVGGRMVVPLGPAEGPQILTLLRKQPDGRLLARRVLEVRFSPLQGGQRT